jgi:hypothetical protein
MLRRYLETEGFTGQCPEWYAHIQAAKYLGIDPEDLLKKSIYWRDKALVAMTAEAKAQKTLQERQK